MAKKKQFAPHIYPEWGELFDNLTDKQNAEILKAITKFPNFEPENNPIWNFIKSQIEKDYDLYVERCNKNGEISRNYWSNKQMISNDIERYPKQKHKQITNNNKHITINNNDIERIPNDIERIKSDPFINPIKTYFQEEYTKVFNKTPRLSLFECNRLIELAAENEDIREVIPIALKKLKKLDFGKDIKFTPSANWLLKDNNFERLLNGEFEKKQENYHPQAINDYQPFIISDEEREKSEQVRKQVMEKLKREVFKEVPQ